MFSLAISPAISPAISLTIFLQSNVTVNCTSIWLLLWIGIIFPAFSCKIHGGIIRKSGTSDIDHGFVGSLLEWGAAVGGGDPADRNAAVYRADRLRGTCGVGCEAGPVPAVAALQGLQKRQGAGATAVPASCKASWYLSAVWRCLAGHSQGLYRYVWSFLVALGEDLLIWGY